MGRLIWSVLFLVCLVPGVPALAQVWPASFRVEGVASGDVLNIRAEPSASAPILGTISPWAIHVEVLGLSPDGRWGKVGVPEGNGWVAMRFLVPTPQEDDTVPRPLSCYGTEPFWSVALHARGGIERDSPESGPVDLSLQEELAVPGGSGGFWLRLAEMPDTRHDLVITRGHCDDGMSDRSFGFGVVMVTRSSDGNRILRGCCTLDHRD